MSIINVVSAPSDNSSIEVSYDKIKAKKTDIVGAQQGDVVSYLVGSTTKIGKFQSNSYANPNISRLGIPQEDIDSMFGYITIEFNKHFTDVGVLGYVTAVIEEDETGTDRTYNYANLWGFKYIDGEINLVGTKYVIDATPLIEDNGRGTSITSSISYIYSFEKYSLGVLEYYIRQRASADELIFRKRYKYTQDSNGILSVEFDKLEGSTRPSSDPGSTIIHSIYGERDMLLLAREWSYLNSQENLYVELIEPSSSTTYEVSMVYENTIASKYSANVSGCIFPNSKYTILERNYSNDDNESQLVIYGKDRYSDGSIRFTSIYNGDLSLTSLMLASDLGAIAYFDGINSFNDAFSGFAISDGTSYNERNLIPRYRDGKVGSRFCDIEVDGKMYGILLRGGDDYSPAYKFDGTNITFIGWERVEGGCVYFNNKTLVNGNIQGVVLGTNVATPIMINPSTDKFIIGSPIHYTEDFAIDYGYTSGTYVPLSPPIDYINGNFSVVLTFKNNDKYEILTITDNNVLVPNTNSVSPILGYYLEDDEDGNAIIQVRGVLDTEYIYLNQGGQYCATNDGLALIDSSNSDRTKYPYVGTAISSNKLQMNIKME